MKFKHLRLGVNIDHIATIRNARGDKYPDLVRAARVVKEAGADGITIHLREDRRHIRDKDVEMLLNENILPINLEIAPTPEMLKIAIERKPQAVCIVPEKRLELTTEGGLDVVKNRKVLESIIDALKSKNIKTSLFVDPDRNQIDMAHQIGAEVVEIHTGAYCDAEGEEQHFQLQKIKSAIYHAEDIKLECHAGHGLTFDTVSAIASIPYLSELNIGHFLISEAIFDGLATVLQKMRACIDMARTLKGAEKNQKIANIKF